MVHDEERLSLCVCLCVRVCVHGVKQCDNTKSRCLTSSALCPFCLFAASPPTHPLLMFRLTVLLYNQLLQLTLPTSLPLYPDLSAMWPLPQLRACPVNYVSVWRHSTLHMYDLLYCAISFSETAQALWKTEGKYFQATEREDNSYTVRALFPCSHHRPSHYTRLSAPAKSHHHSTSSIYIVW